MQGILFASILNGYSFTRFPYGIGKLKTNSNIIGMLTIAQLFSVYTNLCDMKIYAMPLLGLELFHVPEWMITGMINIIPHTWFVELQLVAL